jgi:hypothetical protein
MKRILVIILLCLAFIIPGCRVSAQKITDMTEATSIAAEDILLVVKYPFVTTSTKKITWANILANMGNITAGTITQTCVDGSARIEACDNTSRAPASGKNELYVEGNVWKVNSNGTESYMGHFVSVPSAATTACNPGQFSADASYVYVCYGTNTWRRSSASSW